MASPSFYETITIQDFKNYFGMRRAFTFNTIPLWVSGNTYSTNEQVYNSYLFDIYTSLVDNNTQPLSNVSAWEKQDPLLSSFLVFDEFIEEAFKEAQSKINKWFNALKDTDLKKKEGYLLLTAHCLTLLLRAREQLESESADTSGGFIASESANGVSISYASPSQDITAYTYWIKSTSYGISYNALSQSVYLPAPITINPYNDFSS